MEIHGNKYDYSLVVYARSSKKVNIICPIHGMFKQEPNSHLIGSGCYLCGRHNTITKCSTDIKEFLDRSKQKHGNRYDYSLSTYKNCKTKVDIGCLKHGLFRQNPIKHMSGQGCPRCARELEHYNVLTTDSFVEKAKKVHGNVYDYSQVDYRKSHLKIRVGCPKHGMFSLTPNNHLRGMKCAKCASEQNGISRRISREEFIRRALLVHGDRYKYGDKYTDFSVKIEITCSDHGLFMQTPGAHLGGRGCPRCNESRGERRIALLLKSYNISYERQKRFSECRNIHKLPFDFYLPLHNTIVEHDGKQHFYPSEYFGGVKSFENLKKLDVIKEKFCREKSIKLIRISYKQRSNEIKEIFKKELGMVWDPVYVDRQGSDWKTVWDRLNSYLITEKFAQVDKIKQVTGISGHGKIHRILKEWIDEGLLVRIEKNGSLKTSRYCLPTEPKNTAIYFDKKESPIEVLKVEDKNGLRIFSKKDITLSTTHDYRGLP